jgi:hypothetical protein
VGRTRSKRVGQTSTKCPSCLRPARQQTVAVLCCWYGVWSVLSDSRHGSALIYTRLVTQCTWDPIAVAVAVSPPGGRGGRELKPRRRRRARPRLNKIPDASLSRPTSQHTAWFSSILVEAAGQRCSLTTFACMGRCWFSLHIIPNSFMLATVIDDRRFAMA